MAASAPCKRTIDVAQAENTMREGGDLVNVLAMRVALAGDCDGGRDRRNIDEWIAL